MGETWVLFYIRAYLRPQSVCSNWLSLSSITLSTHLSALATGNQSSQHRSQGGVDLKTKADAHSSEDEVSARGRSGASS